MKIIVKSLMGNDIEFNLDSNPKIRELRNKLSAEFKQPWEMIEIIRMKDKAGKELCPIYSDDSSDENLVDFIRREVKNPELVVDELCVYARLNLGAGFYRPTEHNPKGRSAGVGQQENPESKFFKSVSSSEQSFSARLKKIEFKMENIPEKFQDPITCEIMDNPVMTSSQRTFDLNTLKRVNYVDPNSREQITVVRPNLQLRSEIEKFVTQEEAKVAAGISASIAQKCVIL
jgi:hypothetical protein